MKRSKLLAVGLFGLGVLVGSFLESGWMIGESVKDKCQVAQEKYEGDLPDGKVGCVESLIQTLENGEEDLRTRNESIWALGQLGDRRALKAVKKHYTGEIPDREPYNEVLSQHEMKKAIKLLEGGFNATALVWRNGFN